MPDIGDILGRVEEALQRIEPQLEHLGTIHGRRIKESEEYNYIFNETADGQDFGNMKELSGIRAALIETLFLLTGDEVSARWILR